MANETDKILKKMLRYGRRYASKQKRNNRSTSQKLSRVTSSKTETVSKAKRGRPPQSEARAVAVQELREAYNKLKARINRIEKKFGRTSPSVDIFYKKGLDKFSTKGISLEEIAKIKADVDYIEHLKTSSMSGANSFEDHIMPLIELSKTDKESYNRIMYIYKRMVEENGILEKFKYQVLDMIGDLTMENVSTKDIAQIIREFYQEIYEADQEGRTPKGNYDYIRVNMK